MTLVGNESFTRANRIILDSTGVVYTLDKSFIVLSLRDNLKYVDSLGQWQLFVKRMACYNQSWKCGCGKNLGGNGELHHTLIQRGDTTDPFVLHHTYNVVVLHTHCHRIWQGDRDRGYEYLHRLFGVRVDGWLKEVGYAR